MQLSDVNINFDFHSGNHLFNFCTIYLFIDWKVIGEGPCAPTLKSTSLTGEEYSFTSSPVEDYLISDPEPSSYTGQEYSSSASGTSLYAVDDQIQNYTESAPAPVPYATPDTVSVPSTYEAPQPAPCSAAASDPLPYILPNQSQSYQAPSDSAAAACPHTIALDSAPAPFVALDKSQSYMATAEGPKSYPVSETIPSSAPYEVVPYKATDQNQNFPVPAPYMAQDSALAPYKTQQPATCSYATPSPAPAALPYTTLDQSLKNVVPVAQDPNLTPYEAQKSASAPCLATDQSPNYSAPVPASVPYSVQQPVPSTYEAPCFIADVLPAPAPAPCPPLEQAQNYAAGVSASAPYAAQNAVPATYEAEQTALYPNAAVPSVPTQPVYSNPAPVPVSSPYDVQQAAPCPNAESTPAAAPLSYAAVEQNPAPYVVPNPVVGAEQNYGAPDSASYSTTCQDPAPASAPSATNTYSAPVLTPTPYVSSGPVSAPAPYEVQQPAPYLDTAGGPVRVPAVQVPYEVQQPAHCANVASKSDLSYTAPDQTQSYLATSPAPISGSNANTETAPAYQVQLPATSNQYSELGARLPGSLDLTNLFKPLRRRFGMFVYQPRYTHIIINN